MQQLTLLFFHYNLDDSVSLSSSACLSSFLTGEEGEEREVASLSASSCLREKRETIPTPTQSPKTLTIVRSLSL